MENSLGEEPQVPRVVPKPKRTWETWFQSSPLIPPPPRWQIRPLPSIITPQVAGFFGERARQIEKRGQFCTSNYTWEMSKSNLVLYRNHSQKRDKKGAQAIEKLKSVFLCEGQLMVEMFCHSKTHVKDMF